MQKKLMGEMTTVTAEPLIVRRPLVFVGLMGVGKTTVGRRVAKALAVPFIDADEEIEKAAGRPVCDIFEDYGEAAFRDGERKVIARLLNDGPMVLATGGGAFMNEETRNTILANATSIWLKADLDALVERTARRDTRPLLRDGDPRVILQDLITARHPVYEKADLVVDANGTKLESTVTNVLTALREAEDNQDRIEQTQSMSG